ncbi:5-methyltetrahydropteroyltriglutamate--homocysteine S-methyltransferase [Clostridium kluyveri]|uniref:5-methyltetrahydropteroyltriglutamate--homocysteine methyltransferase n=1 Tax=Clostridium kluyveri TaxID=1534 RepID=A0A1L5F8R1_CLOKL|nr:5-methyltetrahydropteroyltriglutamate--homocysteine S-methyltransferase [Clostridium kluyveri]APM39363.1 5-methyltetrahydropteroyltriglutamate--homocysteine methyltransferase [Clostridium kluyveri]UZQ50445.1 5-methyltetrahydropteroyltriglutamate--homocysteine S-methyltransferase [Clostridium kluyveri]
MNNQVIGRKRDVPPYRYDIVGSFLRPEEIRLARRQYEKKEISKEELKKVEDIEIAKLVKKQKKIGLRAVTDGEFRRGWWHLDFFLGIKGTERIKISQGSNSYNKLMKAETFRVIDNIKFKNHPMIDDFKYLKGITEGCIPKFSIPSPALFHFVESYNSNRFYKDNEKFLCDIIDVYKHAIKAFYDAGCRYLQLDDTTWGTLCSEIHRKRYVELGVDPDKLAKDYVRLINESISCCPKDMTIALHICRGNFHSMWFAAGGYEPVSRELFSNTKVDAFFLEYDNERSGDFSPLRFVKDQIVVLGLVTTKHGGLESKEELKARIFEACKYVDIDKLCLSPQCGFASTEEGNLITEEEQWAKLELIVETAKEIWIQ